MTEAQSRKPSLLVAKGMFGAMRGAERDLIRNLPALTKYFDVTIATLESSKELKQCCIENEIQLLKPEIPWQKRTGTFSTIWNTDLKNSTKAWKGITGLNDVLTSTDAVHLISGDGSFGLIQLVPKKTPFHLHMLEPHRGLYEDILHIGVDGKPKRNLAFTRFVLTKARRDDQRVISAFIKRPKSRISGNSSYSAGRIQTVYSCDAGFIHPSVDFSEFPPEVTEEENQAWLEFDELPEPPWVTTIGLAGWVKGSWETVSMLEGSGFGLVLVGGGNPEEVEELHEHANAKGVKLWTPPRLTSLQLTALMRRSVAVVSMAHGEPFGLTPIEAFAVGTPALCVEEGGFQDTIEDGINGRLLPRDDPMAWQEALNEAQDADVKKKWAAAGREKITKLDLSPDAHARRIFEVFQELNNS